MVDVKLKRLAIEEEIAKLELELVRDYGISPDNFLGVDKQTSADIQSFKESYLTKVLDSDKNLSLINFDEKIHILDRFEKGTSSYTKAVSFFSKKSGVWAPDKTWMVNAATENEQLYILFFSGKTAKYAVVNAEQIHQLQYTNLKTEVLWESRSSVVDLTKIEKLHTRILNEIKYTTPVKVPNP